MDGAAGIIPKYLLYGDPPAEAEHGFVHVEPIAWRSSLHNWEIKPHRHEGLRQILLVSAGGGRMRIEDAEHGFRSPCLIVVPGAVVHGFRFEPGTDGLVLTLSDGFVAEALAGHADDDLAAALASPALLDLEDADQRRVVGAAATEIDHEFHWPRPGRSSAIKAHVAVIAVAILRLRRAQGSAMQPPTPDMILVGRLRHLVEEHFAEHWPVERFAATLGVTGSRLAGACRRVAGRSVQQIVHDRLLLEAKRRLLYTAMTVAEIGFSLGFQDPAYFSRFFTLRLGLSPLAFRRREGRPA